MRGGKVVGGRAARRVAAVLLVVLLVVALAGCRGHSAGANAPYVASRLSRVYHRENCPSVARIRPGNLVRFKTKADAAKSGRRPCRICKP